MPFDWYDPDVPPLGAPDKAARMYERELAERAALLLRLGRNREEAVARLRANVKWDFELAETPAHLERIEAIVDQVFSHGGATGGGPPRLES